MNFPTCPGLKELLEKILRGIEHYTHYAIRKAHIANMDIQTKILEIILFMPGFLFSLSFHEAAHGLVAYKLGDPTAKSLGRVTLNPVPHIDVIGTLVLPIFGLFSGFLFGWGKPVPVDYRNFKDFKRAGMWVALAGPVSNFILAIAFSLVIRAWLASADHIIGGVFDVNAFKMILSALVNYVFLNLALCFFNLIPIQPLDGSKILFGILPWELATKVDHFSSRYGMLILVLLFVSGALRLIMWPPIMFMGSLLLSGL